jgi:hypothetical protein
MENIERRFREIGEIRGRGSEHLVSAVVEPHSDLDYKGIDFFVTIRGQRFPLQVKSSRRGLKKAKGEHPRIPMIRARPGDSIEKAHWRLKSELGKARKRYQREDHRD